MRNSKQTNTDRILSECYVIATTDSRGYSVFLRSEYKDIVDKYDLSCYVYKESSNTKIFLLFDYDIHYCRTILLHNREDAEKLMTKIKKIYDKNEDTVADFTKIDKKNRYKKYSISYDNLHIEKVSISVKRIE